MAQKDAGQIKGGDVFRALVDLVIVALLVCGAGFGGYWWGMHERLAPVQNVPPGTAAALPPSVVTPAPPATTATTTGATSADVKPASTTPTKTESSPAADKGKRKFWVVSSGTDYTGYSIVVNVNGNPVDSFFGPGKSVDITRFVKPGENDLQFEAKALGEKYNKHPGDATAELKVQLVAGPQIREDFKPADVIFSYKRNAAEDKDFSETMQFQDRAQ